MDEEKCWRTPSNDYGAEVGLDSGDLETFKRDPISSLARETGQNAIDANRLDQTTKITYSMFKVKRENIPGIDQLSKLIEDCYNYKKDLPKEAEPLKRMLEHSKREEINCLRISDFNTTGLEGVKDNDPEKSFYLLTKGSGVSHKESGSGGSKGIGKFASFVNSGINTVFYSTFNEAREVGYMGVSKLRSAPIEGEDGLKTQGIAYFSRTKKKAPILEHLNLDPNFRREEDEFGTDIYIIGFNDEEHWEWSIISMLLESFMVAFFEEKLIAEVNGIELSAKTIHSLIDKKELKDVAGNKLFKEILAQYTLLKRDEGVISTEIDLDVLGKIRLLVKRYDMDDINIALQKCIYVRYPYMKIKSGERFARLPFSAMCIIDQTPLNTILRNIENPEHKDWELNRLKDDPDSKRIARNAIKRMNEGIKNYVIHELFKEETESTDVIGAGDFLPSIDEGDIEGVSAVVKREFVEITSLSKKKIATPKKEKNNSKEQKAFTHSSGELTQDGEDAKKLNGKIGKIPHPNSYAPHTDEGTHGYIGGSEPLLKRTRIGGVQTKNILVDEFKGRYDLVLNSVTDEKDAEIEIKMCGDGKDTFPLEITSAYCGGEKLDVIDGKIKMSFEKGKKYRIQYTTLTNYMFSSEVIIYAYR